MVPTINHSAKPTAPQSRQQGRYGEPGHSFADRKRPANSIPRRILRRWRRAEVFLRRHHTLGALTRRHKLIRHKFTLKMEQLVNLVECRQSRLYLDSSQFINTLRAMATTAVAVQYLLLFVNKCSAIDTSDTPQHRRDSRRPRYSPLQHECRLPGSATVSPAAHASQLAE